MKGILFEKFCCWSHFLISTVCKKEVRLGQLWPTIINTTKNPGFKVSQHTVRNYWRRFFSFKNNWYERRATKIKEEELDKGCSFYIYQQKRIAEIQKLWEEEKEQAT